jgi:hypothetical protein
MRKSTKRTISTNKGKSLDQILTASTGLDADERQQWRDCISKLGESGNKVEAMNVFKSFSYWKANYQNK